MKLRTILNELELEDVRLGREDLLDEDVLLTPEYEMSLPRGAKLLRLCRLEEYASGRASVGDDQVLLVQCPRDTMDDTRVTGDVVLSTHDGSYEDLRMAFIDLPAKIAVYELNCGRIFEAFLASYDLAQYARRVSDILGNPVIIVNSDQRLLATAGEFPGDALDVQEVLSQGYVSEAVNEELERDGIVGEVRHSRHSVISNSPAYGRRWVTSIIYYHHLELGRFDVMERDRRITGFDLDLIDYAGRLAGAMVDRLGAAGDRVGEGSSVLSDLIDGSFSNEQTMRAQVALTQLPQDVSYVMLAVRGQLDADRDYHARIGALAAQSIRNCLWCARENLLAVLVPIGKSESVGYDDYARAQRRITANKTFVSALANNGLTAYVSEPFRDLGMASSRFAQCQALIDAAPAPDARVVTFWEHRFVTLASMSGSFERMEMMLDKRVVAMAEYDRQHDTSYLETAIMSVSHPGSPAEAACALNIHRNTYFYRMNKVRDLFFLDLKNGDDRLALAFSARVIQGLVGRFPVGGDWPL